MGEWLFLLDLSFKQHESEMGNLMKFIFFKWNQKDCPVLTFLNKYMGEIRSLKVFLFKRLIIHQKTDGINIYFQHKATKDKLINFTEQCQVNYIQNRWSFTFYSRCSEYEDLQVAIGSNFLFLLQGELNGVWLSFPSFTYFVLLNA